MHRDGDFSLERDANRGEERDELHGARSAVQRLGDEHEQAIAVCGVC